MKLIIADMSCHVPATYHCITAGGNQGDASGQAGENRERWLQPGPKGGGEH